MAAGCAGPKAVPSAYPALSALEDDPIQRAQQLDSAAARPEAERQLSAKGVRLRQVETAAAVIASMIGMKFSSDAHVVVGLRSTFEENLLFDPSLRHKKASGEEDEDSDPAVPKRACRSSLFLWAGFCSELERAGADSPESERESAPGGERELEVPGGERELEVPEGKRDVPEVLREAPRDRARGFAPTRPIAPRPPAIARPAASERLSAFDVGARLENRDARGGVAGGEASDELLEAADRVLDELWWVEDLHWRKPGSVGTAVGGEDEHFVSRRGHLEKDARDRLAVDLEIARRRAGKRAGRR